MRTAQTVANVKALAEAELRSAQLAKDNAAEQHQMLLAATTSSSEIQAAEQASQFYSKQVQEAQNKSLKLKTKRKLVILKTLRLTP